MNLPIHTAVISHDGGTTHYVSASHGDLIARIDGWCREHWSSASDEPPPQSTRDLIDAYFYDNTDDFLEVTEDFIELPQPYASGPELFAALQDVADTPKHGEPEPCDAEFNQDWETDMGKYAIARLHELIDSARDALTKASVPSVPSIPRFTIFCQETGGKGTIHIDCVEAADLESAITVGKQQCIDDWSAGQTECESLWDMESVHCLGVAAGDVEILHWQDQPERFRPDMARPSARHAQAQDGHNRAGMEHSPTQAPCRPITFP